MRTGENALLKESMNLREKGAKFSYKTNVNEKGEGIIFVNNQVEFLPTSEYPPIVQTSIAIEEKYILGV